MNSTELLAVLRRWFPEEYIRVCGIKHLKTDKPGLYIVNTATEGPGLHWVAMYVTETTVDFFDSFGRAPEYLRNGTMFMEAIGSKTLLVHSKCLQQTTSKVCGVYCLAFLYVRAHNMLPSFFQLFDRNRDCNDVKVVDYVNSLCK